MKNYQMYVGIDVSKQTLDCCLMNNQAQVIEFHKIENSKKSIKGFIQKLSKKGFSVENTLFCYENTGIYSMLLTLLLDELQADFAEVPALEIQRSKGICRGKSDKTDAKEIALYSLRNQDKIRLSKAPTASILELKMLFAEREKVVEALKSFQMTSENENYVSKDVFKNIKSINKKIINDLNKSLRSIQERIRSLIKADETLSEQKQLLESIPGIGEVTAVYMILITKGFTSFSDSRKFACYAGIAPFEYSSGTSIRGRNKVNHFADKKIKSLLHMAVLSAIRTDKQLKAYYEGKKEEGKHSLLIINNIKNKLVGRMFATIKRGTPFVDTYKFVA